MVDLVVCLMFLMSTFFLFFFFKQKTAYEVRISYWSSDVCSSDLWGENEPVLTLELGPDWLTLNYLFEDAAGDHAILRKLTTDVCCLTDQIDKREILSPAFWPKFCNCIGRQHCTEHLQYLGLARACASIQKERPLVTRRDLEKGGREHLL